MVAGCGSVLFSGPGIDFHLPFAYLQTLAPPMQSILSRLQHYDYIKIVVFSDTIILKDRVEDWPLCDCLLAFFSEGFPLQKAVDYVKLRRPFVFNDLDIQFTLQDRSEVYEILKQSGIRVPRYAVLRRPNDELSEPTKDTIEVNGEVFHKPFVEKPLSAEDHNVHIYFPSDYGGGCQKLFRKIGNRSSSYCSESRVRRDGSYIYEEFLATDGVDVKVYTVGPDYAHAEARKCPSLDGIVQRDDKGLEKRFPVILTAEEKLMARQVSLAFKQTVCGFDLLRSNGKSYVCDVNGFSFVKKSEKYYDDCAQILLEIITSRFAPEYFPNIPPSVEYLAEDVPVPIPKTDNNKDQLRCVIGIIRHGDRTPKQKMKMIVSHKKFYQLFEEMNGYATGHIRIKEPQKMQQLLDITRSLLEHPKGVEEEVHKLQQLKTVLEMYGYFSGINRKVQFKLVTHRPTPTSPKGQGLLLILKWGGELTAAGQRQAEELGRAFRCMYPGGEGEYASLPGSGFLRLHSTYRHDLKVYASDEGRVQMTAAAFTKGLLDLEGSLASVRTHLVKRDQHATDLLDTSNGADDIIRSVKEDLHLMMRSAEDFTEDSYKTVSVQPLIIT
jgi:inositol hexakisphosphate/diphosphoinositol-pentakisphosphate kinase